MKILFLFFLVILLFNYRDADTIETVVKIAKNSTNQTLLRISKEYNLRLKRELFDKYYLFELNAFQKREISNHSLNSLIKYLETRLNNDSEIEWHQVQRALVRHKRASLNETNIHSKSFRYDYLFGLPFDSKTSYLEDESQFEYIYALEKQRFKKYINCKKSKFTFNDPGWMNQWYINDGCIQGHNLNVTSAWQLGFTGRNIVISIIDDGIEKDHDELRDNYDAQASTDLNDNDQDPQPRYDPKNENNHGTRCAGQIAAKVNNSKCGVGVAFNSRIGGIRLLDGKITDGLEAQALTFNIQHVDIFSSSWGPPDDGETVDGPGVLSRQALMNGIKLGRNGKGTIYVWAAGNGGRHNDNCNCDGYTSSIYTITIGGVTYEGLMPAYSERCSATLASTFSSGHKSLGIVTSDLHNQCTEHHSGTSASAPIAAAIIALALEANSKLTWRDIQYLIVHTSDSFKLKAKDWQKNGNGKIFSHDYGFGLMNAGRMVEWALNWPLVEPQLTCRIKFQSQSVRIRRKQTRSFSIFIKNRASFIVANEASIQRQKPVIAECSEPKLIYLEHVISHITLQGGIRGQLKINLISPYNTTSNLLELRQKDASRKGFDAWPFMSVYHWGEKLFGLWRLEIVNLSAEDAILKDWQLEFFGVQNKVI